MAKVIIGDKPYEIPELNFIALERAWPFMEIAMTSLDPMKGVAAAICIVAAGLLETENFDPANFGITEEDINPNTDATTQVFDLVVLHLKRKTKATEIAGIREAIVEISREAGLEAAEGEPDQGEEEALNPSMGTSAPSSPSSSLPVAKEEAGTA